MNSQFIFNFTDLNKNVIKFNKKLKPKFQYSPKEAEYLIQMVQIHIDTPTTIGLVMTDNEEGVEYTFKDINLLPILDRNDSDALSLVTIVEDQVLDSTEIDGAKLVTEVSVQYSNETDIDESDVPEKEKKKHGIGLFSKGKKGKDTNAAIADTVVADDSDFTDNTEDETGGASVNSPVVEMSDQADDSVVDDNSKDSETSEFQRLMNTEDDQIDASMQDNNGDANELVTTTQDLGTTQTTNDFEGNQTTNFAPINQGAAEISERKTVLFPQYEQYISLHDDLSDTLTRYEERLSPEYLYQCLGLTSIDSNSSSTLNKMRTEFARNTLKESNFLLLKDHFINETSRIIQVESNTLASAYERAMLMDYYEEAKNSNSSELSALKEEKDGVINEFNNHQKEALTLKLEAMASQHEAQIEALVKSLHVQFEQFKNTEEGKINAYIAQHTESIEAEYRSKETKVLDEAMTNQKQQSVRELIEGKRDIIREASGSIDQAMTDVWTRTQEEIKAVKEAIAVHTEEWKQLAKAESEDKDTRHRQSMEIQQLDIERQKVQSQLANIDAIKSDLESVKHEKQRLEIKNEELQSRLSILRDQTQMANSQPKQGLLSRVLG